MRTRLQIVPHLQIVNRTHYTLSLFLHNSGPDRDSQTWPDYNIKNIFEILGLV
jgi:hypothetical protein